MDVSIISGGCGALEEAVRNRAVTATTSVEEVEVEGREEMAEEDAPCGTSRSCIGSRDSIEWIVKAGSDGVEEFVEDGKGGGRREIMYGARTSVSSTGKGYAIPCDVEGLDAGLTRPVTDIGKAMSVFQVSVGLRSGGKRG